MWDKIQEKWCRLMHKGYMNITSKHYECPECHRLLSHNLGECNYYAQKKVANQHSISVASEQAAE